MNTDQTINLPAIARFLTSRESILLFVALSFLLAVVLVVFIQPVSVLEYTEQNSLLSPLARLALMTSGGYATVAVSRGVLFFVNRHKPLSMLSLLIWVSVELIVCVAVTAIMAWSLSGGGMLRLAPLVGDILLGNIFVFLAPNVIAFQAFRIRELHSELVSLRRKFTTDMQAPTTEQSINFYDKGGRLAFSTRFTNVLFIEAADNYANIHYINDEKEDTFILHNTLKDLEKEYSSMGLLRCHRGYLVNILNVKLMRKDKNGFLLELTTSSKSIPVSKSYASVITNRFSSDGLSATVVDM